MLILQLTITNDISYLIQLDNGRLCFLFFFLFVISLGQEKNITGMFRNSNGFGNKDDK